MALGVAAFAMGFVIAVPVFFACIYLSVATEKCPQDTVCDVGFIGGIGIGLVVGIIAWVVAAPWIYVRLVRRERVGLH